MREVDEKEYKQSAAHKRKITAVHVPKAHCWGCTGVTRMNQNTIKTMSEPQSGWQRGTISEPLFSKIQKEQLVSRQKKKVLLHTFQRHIVEAYDWAAERVQGAHTGLNLSVAS